MLCYIPQAMTKGSGHPHSYINKTADSVTPNGLRTSLLRPLHAIYPLVVIVVVFIIIFCLFVS